MKTEDKPGKKADDRLLDEMRKRKASADELDGHNRDAFEDDLRFVEGSGQWPQAIKAQRELQDRPCLTINKLPQFLSQVTNDIRQNRPAIRVKPVDDNADPEVAKLLEGLIRNIEYTSKADQAYDTAGFYAAAGGRGFLLVETCYADDDAFEQDIRIRRVRNPLTVYMDPDCQEADGSDACWAMITRLMPRKEMERKFPKAQLSDVEGENEDWFSKETVRLAEYWTREREDREIALLDDGRVVPADDVPEGSVIAQKRMSARYRVKYHLCTGSEVLETKDWPGKHIPIVPVWGEEIDINGKVFLRGLIRNAKDSQRMYNYWRTTATELVALAPRAPALVTDRQIEGFEDEWQESANTPKPYLRYKPDPAAGGPPQRLEHASVPQGVFTEAQVAVDDMKATTGIYDASLGARGNEASGRAILARQTQGDKANFVYADNLARGIAQVGRIIIDLIPHIYDTARVVRVMGEDGEQELVRVNQPVPAEQRLLNDLTVGKYDVQVVAGPSYGTKRQEAADTMMQMIQAVPNLAPMIGDLIAKNMDWPEADKVAARLKAMLPPEIRSLEDQSELPPEVAAMMQQMQGQLQQMAQQNAELQAAAQTAEQQQALKEGEQDIKRQELALKGYELWLKAELEDRKQDAQERKNEHDAAIDVAELQLRYREDMAQMLAPLVANIARQADAIAALSPPLEEPPPQEILIAEEPATDAGFFVPEQ